MTLTAGTHLGPYEIAAPIGVGGMGEVYRATDTNLKRAVAIKVLPTSFAADPERLARFQREAEVLATLNHPHIAGIYGLERANDVTALVMELVEGPTLAERIEGGAIPLDEALPIAKQIAEALQAAHESNIIHRDLKPANIKIRTDGVVKVLDFGLAKAMDSVGAGASHLSMSPTITTPAMTQAGIILGTAAYMSPEQAKGRTVDRRTDVWAFGCILYEMLTGRRPFDGEDVTDTIAAVVRGEPDWSALPAEASPQIRLLMKRCLEKDQRARVADIAVARFLMAETLEPSAPTGPPGIAPAPQARRVVRAALAGVLVGALIAAGMAWTINALTPQTPERAARFAIVPPADQPFSISNADRNVAISPDGSFIVYRGGRTVATQPQLVVRGMNEIEGRPLVGTTGARNPFISPDGRSVGFFVSGEVRRIPVAGGSPTTVCAVKAPLRGASWGDDDFIVFGTTQGGLQRVPASGGEPKPLTSVDAAKGESHVLPVVLPGARAVLFTKRIPSANAWSVDVLELKSGRHKTLLGGGSDAAYIASGHLLYSASGGNSDGRNSGSLRAVRFDPNQLEVTGESVLVIDKVRVLPNGVADFAPSRRGDLVYVPDDPRLSPQTEPRSLVWVDRTGKEELIHAPERSYAVARISPDGARVALDVRDQTGDIWIWDLARQTLTPLNRDPAQDMSPLWTPDGRRVIWTSTRGEGNPNLYWQSADGTGAAERLTTNPSNQFPTAMAPDGSHVIIFGAASTALNLFAVPLRGSERRPKPIIAGPSTVVDGTLSPDGRWLAYHSNESGEFQVYVRPYPNVDSGRWQISTNGGTRAAWARNGRELFYLDEGGLLTSVSVQTSEAAFTAGPPLKILRSPYYPGSTAFGLDLRSYDVAPDGRRFLMIKDAGAPPTSSSASPSGFVVVLHWLEELKQRMPAK